LTVPDGVLGCEGIGGDGMAAGVGVGGAGVSASSFSGIT